MRKYLFLLPFVLSLFPLQVYSRSLNDKYFNNSNFAKTDNVSLHYRLWTTDEAGPKGKILLIHGFGGSTFSWEKIAPVLSNNGYFVVAVDVPPFGFSQKRSNLNGSIGARAELVNDFIKYLDAETNWHLV
ncbi:MAG: alpha/beta fold hydrolase, partial [Bacteroidota bacterium]